MLVYPDIGGFFTFSTEIFAHRDKKRHPPHNSAAVHLVVKRLPAFWAIVGTASTFIALTQSLFNNYEPNYNFFYISSNDYEKKSSL